MERFFGVSLDPSFRWGDGSWVGIERMREKSLTTFSDHVSLRAMETIPVSKFKATCLAVLQRVNRTGKPVLVTRFGEPVAEVVPPRRRASGAEWLGAMSGRVRISGDVVGPAGDARDWAAMRR